MGLVSFIVSAVYAAAGIAGFIVFLLMQFYVGAVFAFFTAGISGMSAHIIWLEKRRRLNLWYEQHELQEMFWFGFSTFTLGITAFVYHLVYYLILGEYAQRMDLVIAMVWGMMTAKSGGMLMYHANKFAREARALRLIINHAETLRQAANDADNDPSELIP